MSGPLCRWGVFVSARFIQWECPGTGDMLMTRIVVSPYRSCTLMKIPIYLECSAGDPDFVLMKRYFFTSSYSI